MSEIITHIQVGDTLYDIVDQEGRDIFNNSKQTTLDGTATDNFIPTSKAVYNYIQSLIQNTINSATATDATVPTTKAVYDYVQASISNSSSSTTTQEISKIDLNNYYAVHTIFVDPPAIDTTTVLDGLIKISDYANTEGIYQWIFDDIPVLTSPLISMNPTPIKAIMTSDGTPLVCVIANDFTVEDTNFETGETTTVIVPQGIYVLLDLITAGIPFSFIHFLPKEQFVHIPNKLSEQVEELLLNQYCKISNNTSLTSIYSVRGCYTNTNGNPYVIAPCCGGKPVLIGQLDEQFSTLNDMGLYGIYGNNNGDIAIIIATQDFTVPANAFGNSEEISVTSGTYLNISTSAPNWVYTDIEQIKEKKVIMDLDNLFGDNVNDGGYNVTDTLNNNMATTGKAYITLDESHLVSNTISPKEINEQLLMCFENNIIPYVRVRGALGSQIFVGNYPLTLAKASAGINGNVIVATAQNRMCPETAYMSYDLQIISTSYGNLQLLYSGSLIPLN